MEQPAGTQPPAAARPTVDPASRRGAIGMLLAYVGATGLMVALTLALSGLSVMGTDPCLPDSPCIAAFNRWLTALWVTLGLLVAVCGVGVVRARSFRAKLVAVLCVPAATLIVWTLFLANSDFPEAGVVPL